MNSEYSLNSGLRRYVARRDFKHLPEQSRSTLAGFNTNRCLGYGECMENIMYTTNVHMRSVLLRRYKQSHTQPNMLQPELCNL